MTGADDRAAADRRPTLPANHGVEAIRAAQAKRSRLVVNLGVALMLLGFVAVLTRVAQLQLAPSDRLRAHAGERTSRMTLEAPRGDIRDRRGRLLAGSTTGYRLFVDPHRLLGLDELLDDRGKPISLTPQQERDRLEALNHTLYATIAELSRVTGRSVDELAPDLIETAERAWRLARAGQTFRYRRVGGVLDDGALARAQTASIEHVHLERVPVRATPLGETLASVIGFVGMDQTGLIGAELRFDEQLQPRDGYVDYVRDARGRAMWVETGDYAMPVRGEDLYLSVDLRLQQIAEEELMRGVADAGAAGGRIVVVDPDTGEVLALADKIVDEIPDTEPFSTERANEVYASGEWVRFDIMDDDPGREVNPAFGRNRLVIDVYEPGSTFKPFMWAAVLAHGKTTPDETFKTFGGSWRTPYGRLIEDVREDGELSWREVLVYSSNIGMAQGVARLTERQARDAVFRYGFGKRTNVGLPGESDGLVTSERNWNEYTQTSVSFGYEIAVTPMQMVRAFSIFARNGSMAGTLPDLTLLGGEEASASLRVIRRVLEPHIALETRRTLVRVAERMLGFMKSNHPDDPDMPYTMFGKSGTAQIARPDGRGHLERQYNSSFVAGAPVEDPRLVVLVVIDDPAPQLVRLQRAYGSQVAGPVTARVLRRSLEYLGVPHDVVDDEAVAQR